MSEKSNVASFLAAFELRGTRVGEPIVRHEPSGIFLHSRQDPWGEAKEIAREWATGCDCDTVLWGLGLGYVAQALLRELPKGRQLWIIETHPELYTLAKRAHPSWELWQDDRVSIVATQSVQRLQSFLAGIPGASMVRVHAPSQALLRWEGGSLAEILESVSLLWKSSRAHAPVLQSQAEANTPYLSRCREVADLFRSWEDEPILVLGAGPSLSCVLDEVVRLAQRPRMIASNGALPVLAKRRIVPDLAICIESHSSALRDVQESGFAGPLVVFPTVNHELLATYEGPLHLAYPEEPGKADKCTLASGVGTVMAPALDLAAKMGGNPILLAGLDLGWDKNLYADGAMRTGATPQASVRTIAVSDRTLWTSPAFAAFAAGLARIIAHLKASNPRLQIYDLKSSGVRISGAIPWAPEKLSELVAMKETCPILSEP
jgi:hypothetical protein